MLWTILGPIFLIFVGWFIWRIYTKLRWGILELFVTLIGATFPLFLLTRQSSLRNGQWGSEEFITLAMVLLAGILCTVVGSGYAMRWIYGLELERSLWRVPLLMFGWLLLPLGIIQIAALITLPFIIFDRQHQLIPFCSYTAASLLVWIVVIILNRKSKARWAEVGELINIWTRD